MVRKIYFSGYLQMRDLLWYTEKKVLGIRFLELCSGFSKYTKKRVIKLTSNTSLLDCIAQMRNKIMSNIHERPSIQSGTHWFDNMTTYINSLKNIQDGLGIRIIQVYLTDYLKRNTYCISICFSYVTLSVFYLYFYFFEILSAF